MKTFILLLTVIFFTSCEYIVVDESICENKISDFDEVIGEYEPSDPNLPKEWTLRIEKVRFGEYLMSMGPDHSEKVKHLHCKFEDKSYFEAILKTSSGTFYIPSFIDYSRYGEVSFSPISINESDLIQENIKYKVTEDTILNQYRKEIHISNININSDLFMFKTYENSPTYYKKIK